MKRYVPYLLLLTIILSSCTNRETEATQTADTVTIQNRTNKDSVLKHEAALHTDTAIVQNTTNSDNLSAYDTIPHVKFIKKLRYLYAANGGLIGFFDDGSVSGCPRCDRIKEHVATLYETTPHARYEAHKDYLTVNGNRMDFYDAGALKPEWVLFDYKWSVKVFPRK